MPPRQPISDLLTHSVTNQPPPLVATNLFESDPVLSADIAREGAGWAGPELTALGARLGSEEVLLMGEAANRHPPELKTFDRYGRRIDEAHGVAYGNLPAGLPLAEVVALARVNN
jgi:putative acyl-CoA dehydrogenase